MKKKKKKNPQLDVAQGQPAKSLGGPISTNKS
jgi:hypothetical protein